MLHIVVHQYRARCYISDAVNKNISRIGSNQTIQSVVSEGITAQVRPLPVCLDASRRSRAPGWTSCCGAAGQSAWRAGRSPGRSCRSQRCSTDSCWWSPRRDTEKQEGTHLARNGKRKFIKCLLVTYMQKKRQTENNNNNQKNFASKCFISTWDVTQQHQHHKVWLCHCSLSTPLFFFLFLTLASVYV